MGIIVEGSLLLEFTLGVALVAFLIYKFATRNFDYWKKRGITSDEPTLLFNPTKIFCRDAMIERYKKFKGERCFGIFMMTMPCLMITDLDLIKQVFTKDFQYFVDRGTCPKVPVGFMTKNLFHLEGDEWRRMRNKLSPTFTSGKMKSYFILIETITKQLTDHLEPLAEKESTVDVKDLIARFTTDVISTCAFGLEVNSIKVPQNEVRTIGNLMVAQFWRRQITSLLGFVVYPKFPVLSKVFPLQMTHPRVSEFMLKLITDTVEFRKKNNFVRNDFIDLMMRVKNRTPVDDEVGGEPAGHELKGRPSGDDDELSLEEMAAQVGLFFEAGFDTASSTTTFLLYELAVNQHIQDKVRSEIDSVIERNGGKFTYECLKEMHYLEMCINETLRRYPTLPFLMRNCNKAYKIPGTDVVLEENIRVFIPIYEIHHDPEYYPDPFKFNPERFSETAVKSRHQYTFLTFGEGPRICIGKRMGYMQVQMAAITLLRNFELKLAPGLPTVLPISAKNPLTVPEFPVELVVSKRKI